MHRVWTLLEINMTRAQTPREGETRLSKGGPRQRHHYRPLQDPAALLDGLVDRRQQAQAVFHFPSRGRRGGERCPQPQHAALLPKSPPGLSGFSKEGRRKNTMRLSDIRTLRLLNYKHSIKGLFLKWLERLKM